MIKVSINKSWANIDDERKAHGALRNIFPLIAEINREICALYKVCGIKIEFSIVIHNNLTVEVRNV